MLRRLAHILLVAAPVLLAVSCGRKPGVEAAQSPRPFPRVEAPAMYSSQEEAVAYLSNHFWDRFTDTASVYFCNDSTVNGVALPDLEAAMGTYVTLVEMMPYEEGAKAVGRLCGKISAFERRDTSSNLQEEMLRLLEKYLYDPQSPVRNEDLFREVALRYTDSDPRYAFIAKMSALNVVGTQAADFSFTDTKGRRRTLYGISAEYILLIFGNPDCTACKELVETMSSNPGITALVSSGRLKVVDIYIDREVDLWKSKASEYPSEWINGYDHNFTIREDLIYHVRAIPSMYLLDSSRKVILKDAPDNILIQHLSAL